MPTIAHLSDVHFGKIARTGIVSALIDEVNRLDVRLVVVSGDLTQRARNREYRAARAMLEAFTPPTLVVPGNHDVYAWWNPFSRVARPLRRYRRYITADLTPTFTADGLAALGINSAFGRTVKGGRIGSVARQAITDFFSGADEEAFKVLVVHHHLTKIQALGSHDVARKARKALRAASDVGVDLVLCGHLHVSHVHPVETEPGAHRLVIASAGTATSSRGRASNRDTNFYNLIRIGPDEAHDVTLRDRGAPLRTPGSPSAVTFRSSRPTTSPVSSAIARSLRSRW